MLELLKEFALNQGFQETPAEITALFMLAAGIIIISSIVNFIVKKIILRIVAFIVKQSRTNWDDILLRRKVFTRLSHIAPALVIYFTAPLFEGLASTIERIALAYIILTTLLVIYALLDSLVEIYESYEISKQRPVKGYAQIIKIVFTVFLLIIVISTLMGKNPVYILSGLGAMTAVLILVFKDTILGLVASIQISTSNIVQVGDWIEMPSVGADGDVIDISLYQVKVQNWDKTITTIPTYDMISKSFKNWRGMTESGGRRIKRAINIDMTSIRFMTAEEIERAKGYKLLKEYVSTKMDEIQKYNESIGSKDHLQVNGRNLTNVGTFRAYMKAYLSNHPKIHKEMTFLIRQLKPTEHGLPIEMYVFSNDQNWVNYEAIQSDIMDHLLAVLPLFGLRVFQAPTGYDFKKMFTDNSN